MPVSPRAAVLADAIVACKPLLARYLAGFSDVNHTRQTPDLPNHVAWSLGHCALTMNRAAEQLDGAPMPPSEFFTEGANRPDNTNQQGRVTGRYDTEAVCFGSKPEERYDHYPTLARCTEIYNNACDRLAAAVRAADDAALDREVAWGSQRITLHALAARMIFHNGTHCGQIADLRRALGFRSIF